MKKSVKVGILVGALVVLAVGVVATVSILNNRPAAERDGFRMSEEFYETGEFREISAEEFERMVAEKKSFVVVMHMTVCPAEFPITDVAKRLAAEDGIVIFGLKEDEFKKTMLAETVKYLPSAAVISEGVLVDFLDAEEDEDVGAYKDIRDLREWVLGAKILN